MDFGFADLIQLPDLVSDLFGRDRAFPLSHVCVDQEGFLDKQTACDSRLVLYPKGASLWPGLPVKRLPILSCLTQSAKPWEKVWKDDLTVE
jgi:hypothetical protein